MMIDIIRVINTQPKLLERPEELRSYLEYLYPTYKGYINVLMFYYNSGILNQMINLNQINQLMISKWISFMTDRYCFDKKIARDCLDAWIHVADIIKQKNITIGTSDMGEYYQYISKEDFRIGDSIDFGKYYATSDCSMLPVKWRIIDKNYDKILVITEYAIDVIPFNEDYTGITWKNCSLNYYLNSIMIHSLFSENELKAVTELDNKCKENDETSTPGCKLFLLSRDEAGRLFYDNNARRCNVTDYALSKKPFMGDLKKEYCIWWLRETDVNRRGAYLVANDGSIGRTVGRVNSNIYGVRPACWLDISVLSK